MNKSNEFFQALKSKIWRSPDRLSDQIFWNKFQAEFGAQTLTKASPRAFQRTAFFRVFVSLGVASLAAVVLFFTPFSPFNEVHQLVTDTQGGELLEKQPLLEDLELLASFEEIATEDEDWQILLPSETPSAAHSEDPS